MRGRIAHAPRHPGLVPGSTRPRGRRKRRQPPPSPQSGPRNESGVTEWMGEGLGHSIARK
ncbi:hypothetical protein DC429_03095 [Arthrobacter sp. TPD3018]|nr:hypothetical protein DC425_03090 [Sphingomonas sp. TPD3009]PVE60924.1 hypothetical protein DC429_03095 [Arthrobacter sp. TPD3018]PVE87604.1 hypothetical protein DC431_03090 [Sphingomonas melonis]